MYDLKERMASIIETADKNRQLTKEDLLIAQQCYVAGLLDGIKVLLATADEDEEKALEDTTSLINEAEHLFIELTGFEPVSH